MYALPAASGALADASHAAYHAYEKLLERQAKAAAFGLVHLHDERSAATDDSGPSAPARPAVHEHGGAPHAHAAGVDLLLAAAEDLEDGGEHVTTTLVELSSHVPARAAVSLLGEPRARPAVHTASDDASDRSFSPPLPPPRV